MPSLMSAANLAAIADRRLFPRDFLWVTATRYSDGVEVAQGFWSDAGDISAEIFNPDTNAVEIRLFHGVGTLVSISTLADVSNLTVQELEIAIPPEESFGQDLLRIYDLRRAKVEIYRGFLDPASRRLVGPADPRFLGFIDEVEEDEDDAGNTTGVAKCVSFTQELTRSNPDTRSDDSQRLRAATDDFLADVSTVGDWSLFWGQKSGVA